MNLARSVAIVRAAPKQQFTSVRHSSASDFGTQVGFHNHRAKFLAQQAHAGKSTPFWKYASIAVGPLVLAMSVIIYFQHEESHKKARPDYVPYRYMYARSKAFPWGGNKTFFHNPAYNPVPDQGYEVEDPAAHH